MTKSNSHNRSTAAATTAATSVVASSPHQPQEASREAPIQLKEEQVQQPREQNQVQQHKASSLTQVVLSTSSVPKRRKTAEPTTRSSPVLAEDESSQESGSDSELVQGPQAPQPKRKRGPRPKGAHVVSTEDEYSRVVGELVTLAASNVIPDAEDQPGSSVTGEGISPEAETLAASSKDTYLSYLKLYKEFCDNKYAPQDEGRYEVYVFKVLAFFKDFMFKRKVTKVFRPNEKKDVKVAVALYKGPGLRTNFEVQPLGEYLKQVPADPDTGSKTLEVYCGSTVMDVTLKALVHLQTRQKNRIVQPNLNVPIRRSAAIKDALQQYNNSLIFADFHSDRNLFDFAAGENARPERGLEALEEQTNRLKELLTRLESKMDYMMSLLNPPAVGFGYGGPAPQYYPMVVWQACGPSSPSSQQAWGHPGYSHAPPEVVRSQPDGSRSDAAATSPSRPPVPAQKNVSDPARWVPIAPSVRPSVTTSHPQQGPMSAQPQSATTMMTTPTTTPTTGPTTIPTTIPAIPTTLERMIERFIVPKKHQTVDEICADHQAFTDERKKVGKKKEMGLSHAQEKQINNKKRVIEEVQYLADQINAKDASLSQEEADKMAMAHLDKIRIEQNLSVNALVKYCRDKRDAREKSEASEPDSD